MHPTAEDTRIQSSNKKTGVTTCVSGTPGGYPSPPPPPPLPELQHPSPLSEREWYLHELIAYLVTNMVMGSRLARDGQ